MHTGVDGYLVKDDDGATPLPVRADLDSVVAQEAPG